MTAKWRFTAHLILSPSPLTLSCPPAVRSVCLGLSGDSGGFVMSSNCIAQRVSSSHRRGARFSSHWDGPCERAQLLIKSDFACDEFILPKEEYVLWICTDRNYFKALIPSVHFKCVHNIYFLSKLTPPPIKPHRAVWLLKCTFIFPSISNMNRSFLFCFTYKLPVN